MGAGVPEKGRIPVLPFFKGMHSRLKDCARGAGCAYIYANVGDCRFSSQKQKRWYVAVRFFLLFLSLYILCLFCVGYPVSGKSSLYRRYPGTLSGYTGHKIWHEKKNVDCEALEAGMRENFPQITWVSARVSGTRLVIQIKGK